jgi:betaine lipid synthase
MLLIINWCPQNAAEQNLARFPARASDEFEAKRPPAFPPTFLYSLSWEDPREDDKVLHINRDDTVLTLTSGGCNALDLVYQVSLKISLS